MLLVLLNRLGQPAISTKFQTGLQGLDRASTAARHDLHSGVDGPGDDRRRRSHRRHRPRLAVHLVPAKVDRASRKLAREGLRVGRQGPPEETR